MEINRITTFLEPEWTQYQTLFSTAVASPFSFVTQVNSHLTSSRGKQIRPMLSLLSAKVFGAPTQLTAVVAAVVEMVHTATLLHDDVADQSDTRRGALTVQKLYSPLASVLLGDFWLARAFKLLIDHGGESLLCRYAHAIGEMSEGELFQMEKARHRNTTMEEYHQIITKKTAMLMASCMATGAKSAGATDAQCTLIEQIGLCIGVAFQIRDDILDYAPQTQTGKPGGKDLLEGKMTLPLLCALEQAPAHERQIALEWIQALNSDPQLVVKITDFVKRYRGLHLAQEAVEEKIREAKAMLQHAPDNEARQHLMEVVDYLSGRNV
ncbi:MAG: polyprenyl synthetase family protein [Bacteroidales bacterium]|nr:polyprenyl synthetase family protein [Bacteroidales bacterium]